MICSTCRGDQFVRIPGGGTKRCPVCVTDLPPEFDETDAIIMDRAQHYGPPEENFERIAAGWAQIFGVEVTLVQVALAQDWVKTCRLLHDPSHVDSWKDKLGYTKIGERLAPKALPRP